ncbi:hypothetical protein XENOCAPTIV_015704 [Xenoophorus captivus]|uniref:Uncharacterized protein n=1 Tax=Xenoophorus captivus TaxID=1517983 RepID=A0ABV0Q580_9TELE
MNQTEQLTRTGNSDDYIATRPPIGQARQMNLKGRALVGCLDACPRPREQSRAVCGPEKKQASLRRSSLVRNHSKSLHPSLLVG